MRSFSVSPLSAFWPPPLPFSSSLGLPGLQHGNSLALQSLVRHKFKYWYKKFPTNNRWYPERLFSSPNVLSFTDFVVHTKDQLYMRTTDLYILFYSLPLQSVTVIVIVPFPVFSLFSFFFLSRQTPGLRLPSTLTMSVT